MTGRHPATVAVTLGAVTDDAFVFVRRPEGTFGRRAFGRDRADDRRVEIVRGLSPGEPVAVAGGGELATGFAALR